MKRVKIVRCAVCGREFEATRVNTVCCSPKCGREHDLRRRRESHKRERRGVACSGNHKATKRVEALSLNSLSTAKRRPASCSAVRWRIELSRRRLAAAGLIDSLPDPDRLS